MIKSGLNQLITNISNLNFEKDIIFMKNKDSKYIYVNKQFCSVFNVDLNDLIEKDVTYILEKNKIFSECRRTDIYTLENNFILYNEEILNKSYKVLKLKINLDNRNNVAILGIIKLLK